MGKRVKEKKGGFTVEMNGMRYRHSDFSRDVEDVVGGDDEVDEAVVPGGIGVLIKWISKIYVCTLFNGREDFIKSVYTRRKNLQLAGAISSVK